MGEDSINEQDMKIALKNALEILEFTKARLVEMGHIVKDESKAQS
jgi:hypothetical protein